MSLFQKESNCYFISHGAYISKVYKEVENESDLVSFELLPKLFWIENKQNEDEVNRKRKRNSEYHAEVYWTYYYLNCEMFCICKNFCLINFECLRLP